MAHGYGWTLDYVRSLTGEDFERCDLMLKKFLIRDQLSAISAASYPHAKREWQDRYHRSLHRELNKNTDQDAVSTEIFASLIGSKGGG